MEKLTIKSLINKHSVQLRLLSQIDHFTKVKEVKLNALDVLPSNMPKTSRAYKRSIEKCDRIINELENSYKNIR